MSPEEFRKRLDRAGLTPHRLSWLLGLEPNRAYKWARGWQPIPKLRVERIIELTDYAAAHGAAALPAPAESRKAHPTAYPGTTEPEPVTPPARPPRSNAPPRAGLGPLHSDFVAAHNLANQRSKSR